MSAAISLNNTINPARSVPRYRERPRVNLTSGGITGQTVHLSSGATAEAALDLACRLAALVAIPVSVRVDGPLTTLPDLLARILSRTGAAPARLEIALAGPALEHAAVECLVALSAVRDLGVGVALQDFGGPGTLEVVQYLPLSAVILKPTLLNDLPGSAAATTTLHTLLGIARRHGLRIVAAGIESEAQRALLAGLGCQEGEGSLFGTPGAHGHGNDLEPGSPASGGLPKH